MLCLITNSSSLTNLCTVNLLYNRRFEKSLTQNMKLNIVSIVFVKATAGADDNADFNLPAILTNNQNFNLFWQSVYFPEFDRWVSDLPKWNEIHLDKPNVLVEFPPCSVHHTYFPEGNGIKLLVAVSFFWM